MPDISLLAACCCTLSRIAPLLAWNAVDVVVLLGHIPMRSIRFGLLLPL